jgi:uncharacterized protein Yka (UPF0111/DUF47 family)
MGELTDRLVAQQREMAEAIKAAGGVSLDAAHLIKQQSSLLDRLAAVTETLVERIHELEARVTALEGGAE